MSEPRGEEPARRADASPERDRVRITAYPDGPLLVRGDVDIRTADGAPVPRRRRTVALCRCGATGIPPWCDGSHRAVGYRTPSA